MRKSYLIAPIDPGRDAVDEHIDLLIANSEHANNFKLVRKDINANNRIRTFFQLFNCFKNADIVHIQVPIKSWRKNIDLYVWLFLAKIIGRRAKLVVTIHEWGNLKRARRLVLLPLLYCTDKVLSVSKGVISDFNRTSYVPSALKGEIKIVPIGSHVSGEHSGVPKVDVRGQAYPVLLHFGFLYESKQPVLMLNAVAELKRRGFFPKLVLIGNFNPEDKSGQETFAKAIRELGLESNVMHLGHVAAPDVRSYFEQSDVSLCLFSDGLSARRSSFFAALEAGCDIITTEPRDVLEFADDTLVQRAIEFGVVRLVPREASPTEVVDAVLSTRTREIPAQDLKALDKWKAAVDVVQEAYGRVSLSE